MRVTKKPKRCCFELNVKARQGCRAPMIPCPMRSGVVGMSRCVIPKWRTASMTAFQTAGVAAIAPDSPTPLAPRGVAGRGGLGQRCLEARKLGCSRDAVGDEPAGLAVAVAIEGDLLEQGLGRTLGYASLDLAGGQPRIDDATSVVDGDVPDERRGAGLHAWEERARSEYGQAARPRAAAILPPEISSPRKSCRSHTSWPKG